MKKKILFGLVILLASANSLFCQYWQEQIVLKGNVVTQCFDKNEDVLFSSELSNGKFAVCRYSVEKDSIDKVLLVTTNAIEFLEVLTDGTIMAFQNFQLLKSTDNGESWEGFKNEINANMNLFRNSLLKEINDTLIFWEEYNGYHITFDKGLTWDSIIYQSNQLLHLEPTFNACLVGIEYENKTPVFSSDFGKTWEKTNLDTIQLFHFIYSEKIRTIFALSRNNNKMLYKSMNAGKDWEIIVTPTDTLIASYDVDSEGNLLIMDYKNNLYKWFTKSDDIELLSSGATFHVSPALPFYKESYKTGIFLDKKDNIFYYNIIDFKIYKFDYISKKWLDTVDIIHDDISGISFVRSSLKYSIRADKVIINSRGNGLHLVKLNGSMLNIKVPNGAEEITDKYDLGPNGELVFANFRIKDVPDLDSINTYIANYSISSDNGFSRKVFLTDSISAYDSNSGIYYLGLYDFSNMTFLKNNLFIMGYNKTFNTNLSDMKTETMMNPEFKYRIPSIVGASPDSALYSFILEFDYYGNQASPVTLNKSYLKSTDFGKSWVEYSNIENNNYFFVDNIQFQTDGTIFAYKSFGFGFFYYSTDKGINWNTTGYSLTLHSIFTDNRNNVYFSGIEGMESFKSYKNWQYLGDTAQVVATKSGDVFATVREYLEQENRWSYTKIYSSNYGKTWMYYNKDYFNYHENIKSNDIGDVYKFFTTPSEHDNIFSKLIREPNPKPHPLSDTTVYTVFVDVEDFEEKVADEIFIFPNPANEYIEINFERCPTSARCRTSDKIEIYNVLGERVKNPTPALPASEEGAFKVDISDLVPGVYYLRVGDLVQRFVKL